MEHFPPKHLQVVLFWVLWTEELLALRLLRQYRAGCIKAEDRKKNRKLVFNPLKVRENL